MHYDLLVRIKNAELARKENASMPYSRGNFALAKILEGAGYISDVQKKNVGKKSFLEMKLRYHEEYRPALTGFKIMSKPGRRMYRSAKELKAIRQNYGIAVISTSAGLLTNREAKQRKIGGEYLLEVW